MLRFASALLLGLPGHGLAAQQQPRLVQQQGRITDVLGDPVPAAALEVVHGNRVVARARADGEGIYLIRAAALSGAELRVRAGHKAEHRRLWGGLSRHGPQNLVLEDGCVLRGSIVDITGRAVPGVTVVLAGGNSLLAVTADENGDYEVASAPMCPVHLRAWSSVSYSEREVELRGDITVDFVMPPQAGSRRRVRVRGLPADALATACLEVITYDFAEQPDRGRVPFGADGVAEFLLGNTGMIRLSAPGYASEPKGWLVDPAGSSAELVFAAVPEGRADRRTEINGRVTDQSGRGVAGLRLVVEDRLHGHAGGCVTNQEGYYHLVSALPEDAFCRLGVELDDWQLVDAEASSVGGYSWLDTEADSDAPTDMRVEKTSLVRGALANADGQRVVFGEVIVAPAWTPQRPLLATATDRTGRFTVRGLPADEYMFAVVSDRGEVFTTEMTITAGEEQRLGPWLRVPAGAVGGTVVDRNGKPVPGIAVHLVSPEYYDAEGAPLMGRLEAWVKTDRNGRYRCRGLQTGNWIVALNTDEFRGEAIDSIKVEIEAGQTAAVDFKLTQ